jgi:fructokinase
LILAIGEILYDIFPNYRRLGGAPFNFLCHLKHLGFPVRFVSRIGNDEAGQSILKTLSEHQFDTDTIQIDTVHPTGKVRVDVNSNGIPRFEILANAAYDYMVWDASFDVLFQNEVELIYFGSLVQRTSNGFGIVQKVLSLKNPETKCLYDINLRPNCYNKTMILQSLEKTDILKLNADELSLIRDMLSGSVNPPNFIRNLMEIFTIEIVVLTKGDAGSALFTENGEYEIKSRKITPVVDTVGAGDAYAAMLGIGYLNKWHPARIISTASHFAERICMIEGAIPSSSDFYEDFIKQVRAYNHEQ